MRISIHLTMTISLPHFLHLKKWNGIGFPIALIQKDLHCLKIFFSTVTPKILHLPTNTLDRQLASPRKYYHLESTADGKHHLGIKNFRGCRFDGLIYNKLDSGGSFVRTLPFFHTVLTDVETKPVRQVTQVWPAQFRMVTSAWRSKRSLMTSHHGMGKQHVLCDLPNSRMHQKRQENQDISFILLLISLDPSQPPLKKRPPNVQPQLQTSTEYGQCCPQRWDPQHLPTESSPLKDLHLDNIPWDPSDGNGCWIIDLVSVGNLTMF